MTAPAEVRTTAPSGARVAAVLVAGVLAVSFASIFVRLARDAAAPSPPAFLLLVAAGRMLIAAVAVGPVGWRAALRERPPLRAVLLGVAAGVALAAHFATWITSLGYTSVAASTAIVCSNPVWVSVFAWLVLRETPRREVVIGAGLALAGGALIGLADSGGSSAFPNAGLGDFLALVGAWMASTYFLLGRHAQRAGLSLTAYTGIAYVVAALVLLPAPAIAGVSFTGHPLGAYLWIAALGLVPQVVGHTAFNWAVKFLDPALVTTVILLEPVGSAIAAAILFQELPGTLTLAGAVLLLGGVAIAVAGPRLLRRAFA